VEKEFAKSATRSTHLFSNARKQQRSCKKKGYDLMRVQQINRISARVLIRLALVALLTVISGYFEPRQSDEGAAAHIFPSRKSLHHLVLQGRVQS
jgi:hypothetical protein